MKREDIIKLAREAGCIGPDGGDPTGLWEPKGHENVTELMMKFAALVAEHEREACAKVVEADGLARGSEGLVLIKAAGRIRARGEQ